MIDTVQKLIIFVGGLISIAFFFQSPTTGIVVFILTIIAAFIAKIVIYFLVIYFLFSFFIIHEGNIDSFFNDADHGANISKISDTVTNKAVDAIADSVGEKVLEDTGIDLDIID